jgi:hypothetical protein
MGEGNENSVYPSPWDFKRSLTFRKMLRHGTSGFTSHPKEGVLRIFIALKKSIALAGFESATFVSSGKHTNHYTTEATSYIYTMEMSRLPIKVTTPRSELEPQVTRPAHIGCRNVFQLLSPHASYYTPKVHSNFNLLLLG